MIYNVVITITYYNAAAYKLFTYHKEYKNFFTFR